MSNANQGIGALIVVSVLTVFSIYSIAATQPTPLTQKEACKHFMPAVVRIDVPGGNASGFIVSSDGWILTAGHVVFNHETGERFSTVAVILPDKSTSLARVFVDRESVIRDFAILKIDKSNLPFLELGSGEELSPGSDLTIIGYPFSAGSDASITAKFCLSGLVAATDAISKNGVNVDAIYFQGPAVKGLSGGPVISRDSGRVVGIQSAKLAGINSSLDTTRTQLINGPATGAYAETTIGGVKLEKTFLDLINVLDRHLANGLGTATGIDDPSAALRKAQRDDKKEHRQK
jgi:S1-C subfamily serine protease